MVPVRTIEPNYKRTPLSSSSSWKQQALEVSRRYIITSGWVSQRIDEGFRSGLCRDMMRDCRDVQNECNKGVLSGISWKALSNKVLPHLSSSTCYQCRKGDEWALALILMMCCFAILLQPFGKWYTWPGEGRYGGIWVKETIYNLNKHQPFPCGEMIIDLK